MTDEVWMPIPNYERLYAASSEGRIRSVRNGRVMSPGSMIGRAFQAGLSSLRDRAAARLAALRFNPSRAWAHEWEPVDMECETVDARTGAVLSRSVRHAKVCRICGATSVIGYLPCIDGKYFD